MRYSARNIFNVVDPQTYMCIVWGYRISHSLMLIRVSKSEPEELFEEPFFLTFEGVLYFEGPIRWKGVDFGISTTDECARSLNRIKLSELVEKCRLFVAESSNLEIKIIACDVTKTKDIPPDFAGLVPQ